MTVTVIGPDTLVGGSGGGGAGDIEGVTAGAGLTGGGTSGTVTLDVGAGTGITVNANDVAINYGTAATWTAAHIWNTSTTPIVVTQGAAATGSPAAVTITGAAHTTLTASTQATDIVFALARTVQFATGALTAQRAFSITAPTYSFVGASTLSTAATVAISGPPVAGTNATLTQTLALWVESGQVGTALGSASAPSYSFVGDANTGVFSSGADALDFTTGGTSRVTLSTSAMTTTVPYRTASGSAGAPAYSFTSSTDQGMYRNSTSSIGFSTGGQARLTITNNGHTFTTTATATGVNTLLTLTPSANTNQTASTEVPDLDAALTRTVQWATGAITTQRFIRIGQPTIGFVGASTVTSAATVAIVGAPVAGTNATLTNTYALWIQAGGTRLDGNFGMGVAPVAAQTVGAVTNSVTSGGSDGTIANYTDLTIYANDAAAIRNDIYQLARSVAQCAAALRAFGLGV